MKKDLQQVTYKRGFFASIGDFFYDLKVMLFPKVRNRSARSYKAEATVFIIAILAIPLLHWAFFWLTVNIQAIMMAFKTPATMTDKQLAALSWWEKTFWNYIRLWKQDFLPLLQGKKGPGNSLPICFRNTFIFFGLNILVTMPMCLFIAFFIFKKIAGYKVFRVVFYLPAVIPSIVMTYAYKEITSSTGPLASILHIRPGGLLGHEDTALITVVIYSLLTGFTSNMLLFSSGMARIPTEVLEAAKLDGVGPGKEITSIIIPLIWPTFTTQFILAFTNIFSASGPILMLTQGANNTSTFSFWITSKMIGSNGLGGPSAGGDDAVRLVSAMGLLCTLVAVPIVFFTRWLCGKVDTIEY